MAATGYTPISLYYSTTASAVPLAANLANGELGINITDGKLFYKDNVGTVQTIAYKNVPISTLSGAGTGVLTALGINVGTAGSFVVNGGVLGTPSSGTLTNATGLPISTGVSGLGTGVAVALGVNTGTAGAVVVNGGALGTPSSGTLTNATGLPLSTGVTGTLGVSNGGTGQTSYTDGQLLIGNSVGNTLTKATLTAGSGVSITNGNGSISISATGTGGTVTSVGLSAPSFLSVSGSPVTSSGTLALSYSGTALPTANGGTGQTSYTDGQLLIGNSVGNTLTKATLTAGSGVSITNGNGSISISATGSGGTVTSVGWTGGIVSIANPTTTPAFTIAGTSGGIPYFSSASTWATSAALAANAIVVGGGAGAAPSTITTGTGVVTALGVNTGTAGAFVVNGGALGTPSSGTLTNATGLPLSTGVTGTLPVANGGTGLTTAPTNGQIDIGSTGVGFVRTTLTAGSGVSITNGAGSITIAATGSGGTVTSVGLSMPAIFSVSGSPVTTSGTLTASLATQTANYVWAGPTTGVAAAPTFRALVAADIPTLNQNTTGSAATFTSTTQNSQFNSVGVGTAGSGTAGEIRATNNITAYYSSDRKFKENIKDIESPAAKAKAIGGKTFDWTDAYIESHGGEDGYFVQKQDFGVIAQDVEAVFPMAVKQREDGSLAVDYQKLSALALAAIAELTARIEALEAR